MWFYIIMAKTLKEAFKQMLEKNSKFSTADADFLKDASNADLIAFAVVNRAKKNASVCYTYCQNNWWPYREQDSY